MAETTPTSFSVRPIGWVENNRTEAADDDWGDIISTIVLDAPFTAESLSGLREFSHIEVVYLFNRVPESAPELGARRPRNNPAWPEVGIFAQRAKRRPNRIGVTTCELVEINDITLTVQGLDAIDRTPVLDIKPYMREFAPRGTTTQPAWSTGLMRGYW